MKTSNGDSIPFDDDEKNVLVVSCSEIEKYVRYFISCGIPQNTSLLPCYFVKIFKPFFIPLNVFVQRKRNESPSNGNQRLHKWHLVSQGAFWSNRRLLWFDWWTWRNEGKQGKQRAKNTPRSRIDDLQSNKVIALPNKYINDYIYITISFIKS